MMRVTIGDGQHLLVASFGENRDDRWQGLVAVAHPGVPLDWRRYSCYRGDVEERAAFYDDIAHHCRAAQREWLDGLTDVFGSQAQLF